MVPEPEPPAAKFALLRPALRDPAALWTRTRQTNRVVTSQILERERR